jgi:hypothetical protein
LNFGFIKEIMNSIIEHLGGEGKGGEGRAGQGREENHHQQATSKRSTGKAPAGDLHSVWKEPNLFLLLF